MAGHLGCPSRTPGSHVRSLGALAHKHLGTELSALKAVGRVVDTSWLRVADLAGGVTVQPTLAGHAGAVSQDQLLYLPLSLPLRPPRTLSAFNSQCSSFLHSGVDHLWPSRLVTLPALSLYLLIS